MNSLSRVVDVWKSLWGVNSFWGQVLLTIASAVGALWANSMVGVPVDREVEVTLVLASVFATLLLPAHSFDHEEKAPRFVLTFFGSVAYGLYVGGVLYELFDKGVAPSALLQITAAAGIGFAYWAAGGMSRGGGDRWSIFIDAITSKSTFVRVLAALKMQREHVLANHIVVAFTTCDLEVFAYLERALTVIAYPDDTRRKVASALKAEVLSYWKIDRKHRRRVPRRITRKNRLI